MELITTSYGIPKFSGSDFAAWKIQVTQLLREKKLSYHIKEPDDDRSEDDDDEWDEDDEKAKGIIIRCLSNALVVEFGEEPTAYEMWSKILNAYEKRTAGTKAYLILRICSCTCDDSKPLATFFRNFETDVRAFKSAGGEINELISVMLLLSKMPKSYESVKEALLTLDEKELTLDRVKNRFLESELDRKGQNEMSRADERTMAFNANKSQRRFQKKKPIYCFNCGLKGHKSVDCRKPKKDNNNEKRFGGFSRGEGSDDTKSVVLMAGGVKYDKNVDGTFKSAVDSGATDHMFNDVNLLTLPRKLSKPMTVSTAKDGELIRAVEGGTILATTVVSGREKDVTFGNALYVPDLKYNLISVSRMRKAGATVVFQDAKVTISKDGVVVAEGFEEGGLYWLTCKKRNITANVAKGRNDENELWHKRLGHLGMTNVMKLSKMANGMSKSMTSELSLCESCLKGKQTRLPFDGTRPRAKRPLQLVHSDICGPVNVETYDGYRYFVTFIDDYSHIVALYLMKSKDEMFPCFQKFKSMAESHFGNRLSKIRCDNGKEYSSNRMKEFCNKEGVMIEFTTPYSPQLNGVSERMNRTLVEKAKSMLVEANLSMEFWGEAVRTAVYLTNRSPTVAILNKTPFEMWYDRKPDLSKLKVFGCRAYALVPKERRKKFDNKSVECIMLGYADNGYRLWDKSNCCLINSRDVKFDESRFEDPEIEQVFFDDDESVNPNKNDTPPNIAKTPVKTVPSQNETIGMRTTPVTTSPVTNTTMPNTPVTSTTGRPHRDRRPPLRFGDYILDDNLEAHVALNVSDWLDGVPSCYDEIEDHPKKAKWRSAVEDEKQSLEKNETWTLVKFKPGMKLINSRWIFKEKTDPDEKIRYKARLVAKGFMQKAGIDYSETYSPVAKLSTIRLLLAIGIQKNFQFCHLDVKTAFLNGCLEELVFMKPPEGIEVPTGHVLQLNRSLYGLKQSPRCWNKRFNDFIVTLGFRRSLADYCLYTRVIDDSITYLVLYVDDMLMCSNDSRSMKHIQDTLATEFEMKNLGNVRHFMGLNINVDYEQGVLTIDQSHYIEKVLERFEMTDCHPMNTPIEQGLRLEKANPEEKASNPYRELLGSLMYVMLGSRPDICYAKYPSRYQDCSTDLHFSHLKRVLKYLKGSIDWKLTYERREEVPLRGYVDSDFANDIDGRKSTSGFFFQVYGNTISWTSKKQDIVTISTSEAEYVAACLATCDAIFLTKLMNDLQLSIELPIPIHEDNAGCIFISKNPETKRSKHIDVKFHYIRECVEEKKIELIMTSTKDQIADVLTKGLGKKLFLKFIDMMGLKPGKVLSGFNPTVYT